MALTFNDDQAGKLLELLGLPTDTTDTELVLATSEDLASQATTTEMAPSAIAAAAQAAGFEVLDTDTATALRRDAAEGRQIKAAAEKQRIEAAVDEAINRGKITPSRREHWVSLITADPAMAEVLASVADETAVPLSEIGHGQDADTGASETTWFY